MSSPDSGVALTGLKATGEPHLGTFAGAIRPGPQLVGLPVLTQVTRALGT